MYVKSYEIPDCPDKTFVKKSLTFWVQKIKALYALNLEFLVSLGLCIEEHYK